MKTYREYLTDFMEELNNISTTVFIGQQIVHYGNPMSKTVDKFKKDKFIETPVFEETQMGMSLGLAMTNKLVVTFYPRWDFLICATNQLINHVDKYTSMTGDSIHLIIRVGKGSDKPLDPGHQHKGNYLKQFKEMSTNIEYFDCTNITELQNAYSKAIHTKGIYIINEYPELYETTR